MKTADVKLSKFLTHIIMYLLPFINKLQFLSRESYFLFWHTSMGYKII